MASNRLVVGKTFEGVMLETCQDPEVTRPRVCPVSHFSRDIRVEFSRKLREKYPIGTRFRATVKVCQKHWAETGEPKGPPYLRATGIGVIVQSIPDLGLRAKLKPDAKSDRSYYYIWDES